MATAKIVPEQITIYRLRYKGRKNYRRYKWFHTQDQAIDRLAWWLIWDKYEDWIYPNSDFTTAYAPPRRRHEYPVECDCGYDAMDQGPGAERPDWDQCPLHDRNTGYLARVHTRLVRWIKSKEIDSEKTKPA